MQIYKWKKEKEGDDMTLKTQKKKRFFLLFFSHFFHFSSAETRTSSKSDRDFCLICGFEIIQR